VRVGEPATGGSESIELRGFYMFCTLARQITKPNVVGHDENDIGSLWLGGFIGRLIVSPNVVRRSQPEQSQCTEDESES
jgi:hypothetical protein